MNHVRLTAVLTLALLVPAARTIRADVRADERTKTEFGGMLGRMFNLFGGGGAKDGVTSTVAVKSDRKATLNDTTGQIIDLNEEKVYDLDVKKKTYKVTTFAELRRRMEEARKKAEEDARKEGGGSKEASPQSDPSQKEVEVDFSIKNTGERKVINGFDTHEAVMTITVREKGKTLEQGGGMVLKSDMWLAPKIAAMKEVADFDLKYAQKLYGSMFAGVSADQMATAMAMYPMMKDAVAKMNAEGGKIDGTPVLTVTTMEAVQSAEQAAQESEAKAGGGKPSGLGGMLGGMMARKMAQKKTGDAGGKPSSAFLTTTNEVLKVTTDVTAADVAIPAGYQQK